MIRASFAGFDRDDDIDEILDPDTTTLTEEELVERLNEVFGGETSYGWGWSFEIVESCWNVAQFIDSVVGYMVDEDQLEEMYPGSKKLLEEVS